MLDATVAYGMAHFTRVLGWTPEEYQVLAAGVRNEFRDSRIHNWCNLYLAWGRKPMGTGEEKTAAATGAPVLSGNAWNAGTVAAVGAAETAADATEVATGSPPAEKTSGKGHESVASGTATENNVGESKSGVAVTVKEAKESVAG